MAVIVAINSQSVAPGPWTAYFYGSQLPLPRRRPVIAQVLYQTGRSRSGNRTHASVTAPQRPQTCVYQRFPRHPGRGSQVDPGGR